MFCFNTVQERPDFHLGQILSFTIGHLCHLANSMLQCFILNIYKMLCQNAFKGNIYSQLIGLIGVFSQVIASKAIYILYYL